MNELLFYDKYLSFNKECQVMNSRPQASPGRRSVLLAAAAALGACSGIPLMSLPRLAQLSGQLLDADPAQFMVALQVDARIAPPAGAVPLLHLQLKPKSPGAFEPVEKKLPLALTTTTGATLGLAAPAAGRRWLVYSMPPETQAELRRVQALVRQAQAQPGAARGGTLAVGIEQADLAITDPTLARSAWSTWMQVRRSEGFFEVWNGTPEDIRRLAKTSR
jgi:hypothetical protein